MICRVICVTVSLECTSKYNVIGMKRTPARPYVHPRSTDVDVCLLWNPLYSTFYNYQGTQGTRLFLKVLFSFVVVFWKTPSFQVCFVVRFRRQSTWKWCVVVANSIASVCPRWFILYHSVRPWKTNICIAIFLCVAPPKGCIHVIMLKLL